MNDTNIPCLNNTGYSKMTTQGEVFASLSAKIDRCSKHTIGLTGTILESIIKQNLSEIKAIHISGFPDDLPMLRAILWKIYLKYLPLDIMEWDGYLPKKREEYHILKDMFMKIKRDEYENKTYEHKSILELICKDVNRTYSTYGFFFQPTKKDILITEKELEEMRNERKNCSMNNVDKIYKLNAMETHAEVIERILFVYSQMETTVSYKQGMNEIIAPIYYCYAYDKTFTEETVENIEADSFWSFLNVMKQLKSSFDQTDKFNTFVKGEILEKLLGIIDNELLEHIKSLGLQFNMFCYKWFILLLSQEFDVNEILRLWDVFFMEDNKFYYVFYACLAVFETKREKLIEMDDMVQALLELQNFEEIEIESLIKEMIYIRETFDAKIAGLVDPKNYYK